MPAIQERASELHARVPDDMELRVEVGNDIDLMEFLIEHVNSPGDQHLVLPDHFKRKELEALAKYIRPKSTVPCICQRTISPPVGPVQCIPTACSSALCSRVRQ